MTESEKMNLYEKSVRKKLVSYLRPVTEVFYSTSKCFLVNTVFIRTNWEVSMHGRGNVVIVKKVIPESLSFFYIEHAYYRNKAKFEWH